MNKKVSVIISAYNEAGFLLNCVKSLKAQSHKDIEIIIVDDGSTDNTFKICFENLLYLRSVFLYQIKHGGPGRARNYGAKKSTGEILVFVDADMTFNNHFIKNLVKPIQKGESIGTFSNEELLGNPWSYWSICWNIGRFFSAGNFSKDYLRYVVPKRVKSSNIFRAILKSEFEKVHGFDTDGDYSDDESLSRKIGIKSTEAEGAVFFHYNPCTLNEIVERAKWIGSSKKYRKNWTCTLKNIILFSFLASLVKSIIIAYKFKLWRFIGFKLIYDFLIWRSIIKAVLKSL